VSHRTSKEFLRKDFVLLSSHCLEGHYHGCSSSKNTKPRGKGYIRQKGGENEMEVGSLMTMSLHIRFLLPTSGHRSGKRKKNFLLFKPVIFFKWNSI
jgi:hypothetical protein